MRLIRVGAGVVNQTALDWSGNQERLLAAIEEAREAGVQVFCLPELSITGYGCEDAFFSPDVARRAMAMLPVLAEASQGMLTAVGLPLLYQGSLYNVAALLGDGHIMDNMRRAEGEKKVISQGGKKFARDTSAESGLREISQNLE